MFNGWLNLHRPCLYAREVVSDKEKIKKVYQHKDTKTPLQFLVLLSAAGLVAFKSASILQACWKKPKRELTWRLHRRCKRPRLD